MRGYFSSVHHKMGVLVRLREVSAYGSCPLAEGSVDCTIIQVKLKNACPMNGQTIFISDPQVVLHTGQMKCETSRRFQPAMTYPDTVNNNFICLSEKISGSTTKVEPAFKIVNRQYKFVWQASGKDKINSK